MMQVDYQKRCYSNIMCSCGALALETSNSPQSAMVTTRWSIKLHYSCISAHRDSSHVQSASVTSFQIWMAKEVSSNISSCRQTPHPCHPISKIGPVYSSQCCCLCEGLRSSMPRAHCYREQPETSSLRSVAPVRVSSLCHARFLALGTFDSWIQRTFASFSSHCPSCALVQSTRNDPHFIQTIICVSYILDSNQSANTKSQRILATQEFCRVFRVRDFQDCSSKG